MRNYTNYKREATLGIQGTTRYKLAFIFYFLLRDQTTKGTQSDLFNESNVIAFGND